eukprot:363561-Chlamydomonas_euryale.AAC.3
MGGLEGGAKGLLPGMATHAASCFGDECGKMCADPSRISQVGWACRGIWRGRVGHGGGHLGAPSGILGGWGRGKGLLPVARVWQKCGAVDVGAGDILIDCGWVNSRMNEGEWKEGYG